MRMSDWSSDVCSSDLAISGRMPFRKTAHKRLIYKDNLKPQKTASTVLVIPASKLTSPRIQYFRLERFSAMTLRTRPLTWLSPAIFVVFCTACAVGPDYHAPADEGDLAGVPSSWQDRKGVVEGKSVSVRLALGGSSNNKKKKQK